ncbi:hypothetical protein B0G77_5079 [Paraburkholderia sp. BL10I2N1]|nr:hypothetical protein B0G77_5079 [Paraburkholderia sp. BL10I2N1]
MRRSPIDGARENQRNPLSLRFVRKPKPEFVEYFPGIPERFDGGRRAGIHRAMQQDLANLHDGCAIRNDSGANLSPE